MELILHLSDMHVCNKDYDFETEAKLIRKCLNEKFKSNVIEGIVIAITGDIAYSGKEEEFEKANYFIKTLKNELMTCFHVPCNRIMIVTCPGNHDILFSSNFSRNEYLNLSDDKKIDFYNNKLRNYYKSSFNPKNDDEPWYYHMRKINFNNFNINFYSINTTIGSLLSHNEVDKGIHLIPKECFDKIRPDGNDINFILMHHSAEWFNDDNWNDFLNLKKDFFNVVLFGHEHKNRDNHIINENENIIEELCGGELFAQNSIFNVVIIDESKKMSFYKANRLEDYYELHVSGPEYRAQNKTSNIGLYNKDFISELDEYSLVDDAKFRDVYVFPTLSLTKSTKFDKIEDFNDFEQLLRKDEYKFYVIEGDDLSGKTELAKDLFLELTDDYHPLYTSNYDFIRGSIENNFKRIISKEYEISSQKYYQFEDGKILIFDDFDNLPMEKVLKIKKYSIEKFDKIILLKNQNSVNLLKSIYDENTTKDNLLNLSINPMLYRKREKLIFNICSLYYKNKSNDEIKSMSKLFNETINKQLNILNLNPQFIVLCINSLLKNDFQLNSSNGFTSVFQSNIVRQLEKINGIKIDEYLYILQKVCYEAHVAKEYPFSYSIISKVIENYNAQGTIIRKNISISDFINNLENVKMIHKSSFDNNKYCFISSNYYSYFVAKNIVSLISESKMNEEVIDKLIKEMCFGVNGDILLYLAYILQSGRIINTIYNESMKFFESFSSEASINPNDCNIHYLHLKKTRLQLSLPSKKDIKNNLLKREKDEENIVKKKKENVDYYNYSVDDLENSFVKIKQAIKYLELLSKLIPDFIHLNDVRAIEIVKSLYSYSNKIIYYVLKPYEELFDENSKILDELYADGDISDEYADRDKLKMAIQDVSNNFILNVYNLVARMSSAKNTLFAFDNLCDSNKASNEIMNLMIHENTEKLEEFSYKFEEINKKYDDILIENFLKRILKHYCIKYPVTYLGDSQSVINKYLIANPTKKDMAKLRSRRR